ncbi:MAG: leucine-rich repeat protein [Bacteroidaceae bacterium]|nr:leucine-rich repeat protein [Bacteroidaceae bacterium]
MKCRDWATSIVIPEYVTSIGNQAFMGCSGLTSISIPNSVTSIGDKAFNGCSSLTSVTILGSVTSIESYTFCDCSSLTSVIIPNSVTRISDGAFAGCSSLTSVTIPSSVTSIGDKAFNGCSSLTKVTMPDNVISFGGGSYAFGVTNNIEEVHISNLTTWLKTSFVRGNNPLRSGAKLFLNGEELKYLVIPEGIEVIPIAVFEGCESLKSVTLSSDVKEIGGWAFAGCTGLTSVISLIRNPFIIEGKNSMGSCFSSYTFENATLYVPSGTIDKYKATDGWKDFAHIVEGIPTAVGVVKAVSGQTEVYQLDGRKVTNMQHGINIVRDKTGATRKVMMR